MEKKQATKLAGQLKHVFSEEELNALGKRVGFCKRKRDITPYRLGLGLVEVMGLSKIESIADIVPLMPCVIPMSGTNPSIINWPRGNFQNL